MLVKSIAKMILAAFIASAIISFAYDYVAIAVALDDIAYAKAHMGQYISTIGADEEKLAEGEITYAKDDKILEEFERFFSTRFSDNASAGLKSVNTAYTGGFGTATSSKEYSFETNGLIRKVTAQISIIEYGGQKGMNVKLTYDIPVVFGFINTDYILPLSSSGNYRLVGGE